MCAIGHKKYAKVQFWLTCMLILISLFCGCWPQSLATISRWRKPKSVGWRSRTVYSLPLWESMRKRLFRFLLSSRSLALAFSSASLSPARSVKEYNTAPFSAASESLPTEEETYFESFQTPSMSAADKAYLGFEAGQSDRANNDHLLVEQDAAV